jgi:hypothetical protein
MFNYNKLIVIVKIIYLNHYVNIAYKLMFNDCELTFMVISNLSDMGLCNAYYVNTDRGIFQYFIYQRINFLPKTKPYNNVYLKIM